MGEAVGEEDSPLARLLPGVQAALDTHRTCGAVVDAVLGLLARLSSHSVYDPLVLGAVPTMLSVVGSEGLRGKPLDDCLVCLCNLSREGGNREGLLPLLPWLMSVVEGESAGYGSRRGSDDDDGKGSPASFLLALQCLRNLAASANSAGSAQEELALWVARAVDPHVQDPEVVEVALGCLRNLAAGSGGADRTAMLPLAPWLVAVVGAHRGVVGVVEPGLVCLAALATSTDGVQALDNIEPWILQCVEGHKSVPGVVSSGLSLLSNLAAFEENRPAVLAAAPWLVATAHAHRGDPLVAEAALTCLCNLACDRECAERLEAVVPWALALTQDHPGVEAVAQAGARFLLYVRWQEGQ